MWLFIIHILFFICAVSASVIFVYVILHSYGDLRSAFIAFLLAAITFCIYAFILLEQHYGAHFSCSCDLKDIFALVATFFLLCGSFFAARLVKRTSA